ncbi:MAG: hypothetical protein F2668_03645 [Actinobacteria bacterium]|nr:hypothetical protein [Actinomycetota bacterium]MSX74477.1 hypothetical protein [Actinomycetota bacterium]MSY22045.1 hypothetical protein [Actinomycetota bacterium]
MLIPAAVALIFEAAAFCISLTLPTVGRASRATISAYSTSEAPRSLRRLRTGEQRQFVPERHGLLGHIPERLIAVMIGRLLGGTDRSNDLFVVKKAYFRSGRARPLPKLNPSNP